MAIVALGMTAGELAQTIIGLVSAFVGPLAAVMITQRLARKTREREGKMQLFKDLLNTHHLAGDPDFTASINLARVEFVDCPAVVAAVDRFVLSTVPGEQPFTEDDNKEMKARCVELLSVIANELGFGRAPNGFSVSSYAAGGLIHREMMVLEAQQAQTRIANALERQTAILQAALPTGKSDKEGSAS